MPPVDTQVTLARSGSCVELCLRAPEGKPPTLHEAVLDGLEASIDALERDLPRCVVVRSASDRFFCVGADVSALERLDAATIPEWVKRGHEVFNRLGQLGCPVIASVRGYALGGGLELAMACDVIVVDRTARLGLTEAALGFVPGWGGSHRLARRVGAGRAKAMFFTGELVGGEAAEQIGLADRLADDPLDEALSMAEAIAERGEVAVRAFKAIRAESADVLHEVCQREMDWSVRCVEDSGTRGRVQAFLESRVQA